MTPTIAMALYNSFGPKTMFLSGAVMGTISFILALFVKERYQRPKAVEKTTEKKRPGFRFGRGFALMILLPSLVNFFVLFGDSAVQSFLIPCGMSRGIGQISLYFMVNQLVVIFTRLAVDRLIIRIPKRSCILVGLLMAAVGTALIAAAYSLPMMLLSAVLLGLGYTAVTQVLQAEVLLTSPVERRGVAGTTFMLLGNIGGMGTALWGRVSSGAGYGATYILAGAATLLGCLFHGVYWRKRQEGGIGCKFTAKEAETAR